MIVPYSATALSVTFVVLTTSQTELSNSDQVHAVDFPVDRLGMGWDAQTLGFHYVVLYRREMFSRASKGIVLTYKGKCSCSYVQQVE
jgi:hypothetical protein